MLTEEQINKINKECPYDQGIYYKPYGIPTHIESKVIYCRYNSNGMSGGSCWGDEATYYQNERPNDWMKVLDLVLEIINPQISYLNYRKIQNIIQTNTKTNYEYYGNESSYYIEYIVLDDLYKIINPLYGNKNYE